MRKFDAKQLTLAAVIAAAYAAPTLCLPAYGAIQVRLSEAFTVLPFLFPAAVPGVAVGVWWPICSALTGSSTWCAAPPPPCWPPCGHPGSGIGRWRPAPPVLCNGAIIGAMLAWYEVGFGPGFWGIFAMNALTVGLGEAGGLLRLGLPILIALPKIPYFQGRMSPERLS